MRVAKGTARQVLNAGQALSLMLLAVLTPVAVRAAVTSSTLHGPNHDSLNGLISSSDLIHGRQTLDFDVYENPSDSFGNPSLPGWHPANTNPADQIAAFTDGAGILATGLTGLLNDANVDNPSGRPAKIVQYPFTAPVDIGRINIFSGNRNNADSRIFSTVYVEYSTDNAFNFHPLGYFTSDPSGTINDESNPDTTFDPPQKSTLMSIFDNGSATMVSGVTDLIFNFYAVGADIDEVSPLRGVHGDPFDGVNTITGVDDGIRSAFVSPLIFEIDVLAPSTVLVGDYNGDTTVDAADYTNWRDTLGANVTPGSGADGSGNGMIDEADYQLWKLNFGASGGAGAGTSVAPEPSSVLIAILPLIAAGGGRGFGRSRGTRS